MLWNQGIPFIFPVVLSFIANNQHLHTHPFQITSYWTSISFHLLILQKNFLFFLETSKLILLHLLCSLYYEVCLQEEIGWKSYWRLKVIFMKFHRKMQLLKVRISRTRYSSSDCSFESLWLTTSLQCGVFQVKITQDSVMSSLFKKRMKSNNSVNFSIFQKFILNLKLWIVDRNGQSNQSQPMECSSTFTCNHSNNTFIFEEWL